MVLLWSTAATRDVALARRALGAMRAVPDTTAWIAYLRCHDDIGWAIADEDAARRRPRPRRPPPLPGRLLRRAASRARSPAAPTSSATRSTGDVRTSGMAASLAGIDEALALGDEGRLDDGVRRLLLLYSVVFSYGGVPLIWMGDEIALPNAVDVGAVERDGRWLHRPAMDWTAVERRHDPRALEGLVFPAFQRLAQARQGLVALRAGSAPQLLESGNRHVLAYVRRHPRGGAVLVLANFAESAPAAAADAARRAGRGEPAVVAASEAPELGPDAIGLAGPRLGLADRAGVAVSAAAGTTRHPADTDGGPARRLALGDQDQLVAAGTLGRAEAQLAARRDAPGAVVARRRPAAPRRATAR